FLSIRRFRGIEKLLWHPGKGVECLLGGGDVGKTTILEAIALLLNPTNASTLSDADYWQRKYEDGFKIGVERLLSDKTLRSCSGNEIAKTDVEGVLQDDAKTALGNLDKRFGKRALPTDLSLGLVGGPGFSLNALIGLTATKDGTMLPLSSWGAGTRRLAALEVAAAHQVEHPVMVVDEIERGWNPTVSAY
ncbi:MAG: hypothetical protein IPN84_17555, partial [Sphingomonadales bacterium]|nr:hypothetical protein [Sphingomonadales bacterium]